MNIYQFTTLLLGLQFSSCHWVGCCCWSLKPSLVAIVVHLGHSWCNYRVSCAVVTPGFGSQRNCLSKLRFWFSVELPCITGTWLLSFLILSSA
ncbi:hypothetical protein Peur_070648 [Populus x canadensis]